MRLYPAHIADQHRSPVQVIGGDSRVGQRFEEDVMRLLRYLHYEAGSRTSFLIMQGLINNGDRAKRVTIRWAAPTDNAVTLPSRLNGQDNPNSTPQDFLANARAGTGAVVHYNPWEWPGIGSGAPGRARDEILLHELVHAYMIQRGASSLRNLNTGKYARRVRRFTIVDDFFAVMVANVYASECGRPPREDHNGYDRLDQTGWGVQMDPAFKGFFDSLNAHLPQLADGLKAIDTGFNPWNPRKTLADLLDAQLY